MNPFQNSWFILPAIGAAVAVPLAVTDNDIRDQAIGWFNSGGEAGLVNELSGGPLLGDDAERLGLAAELGGPRASIEGPHVANFGEVIRFNVTPDWVAGRWGRVTNTPADANLHGMRVAMVTGYQVDDLAGSLTYYFDHKSHVQRITFQGFTGDARRLQGFVKQFYGLERQTAVGAGLQMKQWNGEPVSVLRVKHAPVVKASTTNSQYEVYLELNRPEDFYNHGFSPLGKQILQGGPGE